MASPITPSDTAAVVINPSDDPCVAWQKYQKALILFYRWVKYRNAADGLIADAWQADLCPAVSDCPTT